MPETFDSALLRRLLTDLNSYDKRRATIRTLGNTADARAVAPLIAVLREDDASLMQITEEALSNIGSSAVPDLITCAHEDNKRVRGAAIRVLAHIKDRRAKDVLISALGTVWGKTLERAMDALVAMGSVVVEQVAAAACSEERIARRRAILVLGRIADPRARRALLAGTKDHDSQVRAAANEAILSLYRNGRLSIPARMQLGWVIWKRNIKRFLFGDKKKRSVATGDKALADASPVAMAQGPMCSATPARVSECEAKGAKCLDQGDVPHAIGWYSQACLLGSSNYLPYLILSYAARDLEPIPKMGCAPI